MRTLIDLHEAQVQELAALAGRTGLSRAAIVREAVAEYLERRAVKPLESAFGLWGKDAPDGLDYQHEMRAEW